MSLSSYSLEVIPENYRAILHAQWRERRMRQEAKAAEFQRRQAEARQLAIQEAWQKSLDEELLASQQLAERYPQRILKIYGDPSRIPNIQAIVADYYGVSRADILGRRRMHRVVRPRMVAMYLSRVIAKRSWHIIAHQFARDHTSAINAFTVIAALIETNPLIAADVAAIRAKIEARK